MLIILGIQNYNPVFFEDENILKEAKHDVLKSIPKQLFLKIFWVWDKKSNEWFKDCPVVIQLSDGFLTLCAYGFSDFALGWNDIQPTSELKWYGEETFDLEWREYTNGKIKAMKGKEILNIKIIKYRFAFHNNKKTKLEDEGVLHGVGLQVGKCIISVINGLDENCIEIFYDGMPEYLVATL